MKEVGEMERKRQETVMENRKAKSKQPSSSHGLRHYQSISLL